MPEKQPLLNRFILLLLIAAAVGAAGYALQHTVSCFLLSFVIAYLFDPFLVILERRKVRRVHGIILLYLILTVFSVFFIVFFVPFISLRWEAFIHGLPLYLQKGKELALAWKTQIVSPYDTEESRWILDTATGHFDKLVGKLGAGVYAAAAGLVFNIFNLVLAPILVFFMLFYKKDIHDWLTDWIPVARRDAILDLGREINSSIGGYLRGQLVVSAIVAILSSVALFFLDVDYAIFNGIFAGLASVLPFIGVILATIPPLFFAYVKFQSGVMLVKVLVAFGIIYFLEGYLVKPLVFKESLDLNPLVTIIVVMAFGELMGFWGILLAIPIAAAIKILFEHARRGDFSRGA